MSVTDSLFAGVALGVSIGSAAYAYQRLHQISQLVMEITDVLKVMSGNVIKMDTRLQLAERHDDSLKGYVDEAISEIRTQLPSIEC